jgi:tRNA(Ile)-lysidine synthetase-like protein
MSRDAVPHAFRLALIQLRGEARDVERKHYAIMQRAVRARTGSNFSLPRGVTLTVDATRIILSSRPLDVQHVGSMEHPLPFDGHVGAWRLRVLPAAEAAMAVGGIDLRLPEGAVVRGCCPGDRVRSRAGSKKLADWYIDRKIPRRERDSAPVIAFGNQVFWTPWGSLGELPRGVAWRISWHRAHASAQTGALDAAESVPV